MDKAGNVNVTFVLGCSRLAPRTAIVSVPRLELCAALLAVILACNVLRDLGIKIDLTVLYSDSQVVLGYIHNETRSFSRYVTRRVDAIVKALGREVWKFVPTDLNPADLGTRPLPAEQVQNSAWLRGPEFLRDRDESTFDYVTSTDLPETVNEPSRALRTEAVVVPDAFENLASRVSSWRFTVRVAQVCLNWLAKGRARLSGSRMIPATFAQAEMALLSSSQAASFPELFDSKGVVIPAKVKNLSDSHSLSGLAPVIDGNALRVGGRLRNAVTEFEVKHPLIISSMSMVARRFCEFMHFQTPHQGRVVTTAMIRQRGVFVIGLGQLVRDILRSCVECARLRREECGQLMAQLPEKRVTSGSLFDSIGIDVFGPFMVHDGRTTRRTKATVKTYVLMINCLTTRAVHLEVLTGLDTSSVINALRRFFAERGEPSRILSDRGTNFIGAINQSLDFQAVQQGLSCSGISWELNPAGASHFGGAYERKIGSVRRVLEAAMRKYNLPLSRDEFTTLIKEAARIVNSTPLYVDSGEKGEPLPITPYMLLTMKTPSASVEEYSESHDLNACGKRQWRRLQLLADTFWKVWRQQYLQTLTSRSKWRREKPNVKAGDIVIIRDKQAPRADWRLGLVERPIAGKDGLVRRVMLGCVDGRGTRRVCEKAIHDLVLLHSPG